MHSPNTRAAAKRGARGGGKAPARGAKGKKPDTNPEGDAKGPVVPQPGTSDQNPQPAVIHSNPASIHSQRSQLSTHSTPTAETEEERQARLKPFVRSITTSKRLLTRQITKAEDALQRAFLHKVSATVLDDLRQNIVALKKANENVSDAFSEIIVEDYDQFEEGYEKALQKEDGRTRSVLNNLVESCNEIENALADSEQKHAALLARAGTSASGKPSVAPPGYIAPPPAEVKCKPMTALKPHVLSKDVKPVEYRVWRKKFEAYFIASRMDHASIQEQQAHFLSCLNAVLSSNMNSKMTDKTAVLKPEKKGDPTCLDFLEEEFKSLYPTHNRNYDYFTYVPPPGTTFSDAIRYLKRLGDEADLTSLKIPDDLHVFRIFSICQDRQLAHELSLLPKKDLISIENFVREWETSRRQLKHIPAPGPSAKVQQTKAVNFQTDADVNATTTYKRGRSQSLSTQRGSSSRPGSISSGNSAPAQPSATGKPANTGRPGTSFRCFRCGNSSQNHNCSAINAICGHCRKKGHFKGVCNSKAQGKPPAPKPSSNQATAETNMAFVQVPEIRHYLPDLTDDEEQELYTEV